MEGGEAAIRRCPRDGAHLQPVAFKVGHVTADVCPTCHGMYLDKNEILRMTSDRELNARLRDRVVADVPSAPCPGCGGQMDEEEAAGVVVDVCTSCFGLWLDAGELDRLRQRPAEPLAAPPGTPVQVARRVPVRPGAAPQFSWAAGAVREIQRRYL